MSRKRILIIEDEIVIRTSLKKFLEKKQYKVTETGSLAEALQNDLQAFALIITDLRLPGPTGTDIIPLAAGIPVLVMTSYASVSSAVDAMKLGAADYISKPFEYQTLLDAVEGLIGQPSSQIDDFPEIIGECAAMQELFVRIRKVAPTHTNVLIIGESGTGKELVAKALHQGSPQHNRKMVSLNCAAIPETLIESELFGHEKGAFTGATSSRVGLVEAADGGTLFLDEIGELPLEAQARLLRVLQEGEIRKVGSVETRNVSVRLIAATHRDLKRLTKTGEFREDLYYRLNVVKLSLPPLRERPADLPTLARYFLHLNCAKLNKPCLRFSEDTLQLIQDYAWPGNIRELKNAIERAVILCEGSIIEPGLLAVEVEVAASRLEPEDHEEDSSSLEDYFARFVLDNQDHMTETELAQKLGISRKALWQRRQRLSLPRERSRKQSH
ncbi:MAG: two-component system response regulator HydG [Candidatus Azotimanducaceae bacterium]|jgi:two-component system response regulator HydG